MITQEYTCSIEDLVKRRVKESRYDDVVPPEGGEDAKNPSTQETAGDLSTVLG